MTLKHYDFEAGTNGLAATTANTGATTLTLNGGSATFDTAAAANGTLGLTLVSAAGADCTARFSANAPSMTMSFSVTVQIDAVPASNITLFNLRMATGPAFRTFVATNGHLQIDGTVNSTQIDTGVVLTPGSKFRIEVQLTVGTTSTNGQVSVSVFAGNSATAIAAPTASSTFNLGTAAITAADLVTTASRTLKFDDVRFNDGSTTPLGPVPNNKAAAGSVRPFSTVSNPGAFTTVGSLATPELALADESDTTYIQSPGAPNGAAITVGMDPLTAGPVTVKVRHQASTDAPTISRKYDLIQGTTVIATRTVTLTTSWVDYSFTTTTAETAAITSPRNNLALRVTDTSQ